ncbi:MAG TPA: hypothetical protein VNE39_24000 [Planctomycetota bacterium]|nr:hypothetical protein [Planctomycetota bacterium]
MAGNKKEREVLRGLARQVAEIAALPVHEETISAHKALNALKPVRPMVMIDQVCWHEMNVGDELTLRCEDSFCRGLETRLRRTLYQWKHMRGDMVIEPFLDLGKAIRGTDFGLRVVEQTAVTDPTSDVLGHHYVDQLRAEADLEKIRMPQVWHDEKATAETEARARELFDGILTVRMQGACPVFAPWDRIVCWHGAEETIMDLAFRPDFMHRVIARVTEASLSMLDQLEAQGLLGHSQGTIHCTGAYSDELPAPGFDPDRPRPKDLWTYAMAQIFSTVSPAMHYEFEIAYATRWTERFGLCYYGCCEPLDDKIDMIRRLPRVRKISMSPWVSVEKGAERIGRDYVFSRKPNPAFLAGPTWEPGRVERDLRDTLAACARHGCPVEFILKDISTVCYQPRRLWEWAEIARRVVGQSRR